MLRYVRNTMESGSLPKAPFRPSYSSDNNANCSMNFSVRAVPFQLQEQSYSLGKSIGEGSYCKVKIAYKAKIDGDICKIACKIIDKRKASNDFVTKFLPRELSIIRDLSHPNIVTVVDVIDTSRYVYMFMDLCEKGDLLDHIRTKGALTESRSRHFFRQIVSAVEYLHALDIAHRDLKCENILLATKDNVKITDFGFARWCCNERGQRILSNTFCGSTAYAAPEILQGSAYNPKMYDSWSLGCVLYVMLIASMPFDDANIPNMIRAQNNSFINFPNNVKVSGAARRLILHLLQPDITRRATMRQVVKSSWLRYPPNHVFSGFVNKQFHCISN